MYSYHDLIVCFYAINWKVFLPVFRLSNSVCLTKSLITCFQIVQGYPQEDSSCSSIGCSLAGIRNAGNSFPASGRNCGSVLPAFFEYRTSNPGGHPYEQRCSYQSEKFKLRGLEKSGRETGGLMLNIIGLNRFSLSAISTICAANMIRSYPSSISS